MKEVNKHFKNKESGYAFLTAIVIKLALIANYLCILEGSMENPVTPVVCSSTLFLISVYDALFYIPSYLIIGVLFLYIFSGKVNNLNTKILKYLVYFIFWYLILNLFTVHFFTSEVIPFFQS